MRTLAWMQLQELLQIVLALLGILFAINILTGCAFFQKRDEGGYPAYCYDEIKLRAKIAACVAEADARAESYACRKQVNVSCGIQEAP